MSFDPLSKISASKMLKNESRRIGKKSTKNVLLITAIASLGLTACSPSQMSKTLPAETSSTVNQDAAVVSESIMASPSVRPSVISQQMMIRSAAQTGIVRPSPSIIITPEAKDNYQKKRSQSFTSNYEYGGINLVY
ncbi:hypothetical protein [Psychrobacter sp. JCM 18901]|uniref:hypothetical protein n=1 Tax=Psychrobacter sp. JCM 18901 TaxID=1298609 RepID=UPI0004B4BC48|nr:hypothetical protein [Psychrobacter sp. JCM 18901]